MEKIFIWCSSKVFHLDNKYLYVSIFQNTNAIYEDVNSIDGYDFSSFPSNNFITSPNKCEIISSAANFNVPGNRKIRQYSKPTKFPEHFLCPM